MKFKLLISLLIIILCVSFGSVAIKAKGLNLEGEIESRLETEIEKGQIPLLINNLELDLEYYSSTTGLAKAVVEVSDQDSDKINLKEVYTELYLAKTDLRIGKQKIFWGKTDGINPTNNFNPEDLTRSFRDDSKIAVTALRLEHYYKDWTFDLVWVPKFTPPNFGDSNNRWTELLPEISLMPKNNLENSEFGIRTSRWGSQIDFSFSYFQGYSKEPYLSDNGNFKFYRVDVLGADFAKDFGSFVIRGEGAYFYPTEELKNKEPYYKIVLGADKNLTDKLYINTQYYREQEKNKEIEQKITLSTEYNLTDFKQLILNMVYNLNDKDHLINPEYSVDVNDNLTLTLGGIIFSGDQGTELGKYDNKDYVYCELQRSF